MESGSMNAPKLGLAAPAMPGRPLRTVTARSSLFSHSFPAFYACYLLKSIKTPESTAVYIGSTPSPPRRIRQHNGEIAQGARKTSSKRPWVMQMIVHGFPSRVAALQFEWAWQHPHTSRHLRDAHGKQQFSRVPHVLGKNIEVVQAMIRSHPFNLWPLHVKLFTEEARDTWHTLLDRNCNPARSTKGKSKDPPTPASRDTYFPPGFIWTVELEGVDGKSGHLLGSGRTGPLEVKDEHFTSVILAKNTALMASANETCCAVCGDAVGQADDALTTLLCPHDDCLSISHVRCLSTQFLASSNSASANSDVAFISAPTASSKAPSPSVYIHQSTLIPRGGNCPSCTKYTLWGDLVRGSYRRVLGAAVELPDNDPDKDPAIVDGVDLENDLFASDSNESEGSARGTGGKGKSKAKAKGKKQGTARLVTGEEILAAKKKPRKRKPSKARSDGSSSGETFDLDVSSSSSEDSIYAIIGKKTPKARALSKTKATKTKKDDTARAPSRRLRSRSPPPNASPDSDDMFLPDTPSPPQTPLKNKRPAPKTPSTSKHDVPTSPGTIKRPRGRPRKVSPPLDHSEPSDMFLSSPSALDTPRPQNNAAVGSPSVMDMQPFPSPTQGTQPLPPNSPETRKTPAPKSKAKATARGKGGGGKRTLFTSAVVVSDGSDDEDLGGEYDYAAMFSRTGPRVGQGSGEVVEITSASESEGGVDEDEDVARLTSSLEALGVAERPAGKGLGRTPSDGIIILDSSDEEDMVLAAGRRRQYS